MNSYRIAEICFSENIIDRHQSFEFAGIQFEVQRFGVHGHADYAKRLIESLSSQVDAFAITGLHSSTDKDSFVIRGAYSVLPICDGENLKDLVNQYALERLIDERQVDPYQNFSFDESEASAKLVNYIKTRFPQQVEWRKQFKSRGGEIRAKNVYLDLLSLPRDSQKLAQLAGKNLLICARQESLEEIVQECRPKKIFQLFPEAWQLTPDMNYAVFEAVLRLKHHRSADLSLHDWKILIKKELDIDVDPRSYALASLSANFNPLVIGFKSLKKQILGHQKPDFAFIIHALSHDDFTRLPGMKVLNYMPEEWNDSFDRLVAKLPPAAYGEVQGVVSEFNGRKVRGLVYGLFATPKALKEENPQVIYEKIESICRDAQERGAKIIGLGAYTKIIGDQGLTIHRHSPIPVTTGNSLSAAATLWALGDVVRQLDILKTDSLTGIVDGTAMVIGATGSIGQVSAKLLSMAYKRVLIVAPRLNRLQELKEEIEKISPDCEVEISTDANILAAQADVLVTATSAVGKKIVDVQLLKPGCVVCDCSRPLDFDANDAKSRPDVLIIESGEVILPGESRVTCDLGLPGNIVYACLAETALLAMEERYEAFTLGRDIEWEKVKQIYKMARKHGVKLAAIQGPLGLVTEADIQRVKSSYRSMEPAAPV